MLYKKAIEPGVLELLKQLQSDILLTGFHLAGGTSLAMQIGHRISIDLDLFTQSDFEKNVLLEFLEEKYHFTLNFSSRNTLKGSIGDVNIDLIAHKYPLVKNIITEEGVRLYSMEDIVAMILNAIAGNGSRSKDFINVYFILKKYSLEKIIEFYRIKYSGRNQLHVVKSLSYFDDISLIDWPKMILEKNLSLSKIEATLSKEVKKISQNKLL